MSSYSNLISFRHPKKLPGNHELCSCCSTARKVSSSCGGVKIRASGPQASRSAKLPRTLQDPASFSLLHIPNSWGAKRARSALIIGDPLLPVHHNRRDWANLGDGPAGLDLCCGSKRPRSCALLDDLQSYSSLQIPNSWGAKRARSALLISGDPLLLSVHHHNWRDWANLGDGPAGLIAERLLGDDVADYVCFRAVCRPWRLCCTDPRAYSVLDGRFHPWHWIMLRSTKGVGGGSGGSLFRRGFMNISTGRCRYVDLPELRGQEVFGPTAEGLLVLLDKATYVVRLLNPFTRHTAELPPVTPLLTESYLESASIIDERSFDVSGAGLANCGSVVAVYFKRIRTLAIAKPGDEHWIVVDRGRLLWSALSFAGRFYCATTSAVMVLETGSGGVADHSPPCLAVAAELMRPFSRFMMDTVHLVDNDGELMLVDRECNGSKNPRKHWVYRLDLDARKMLPVCGLNGRAVFIGIEMSLSVSPSVFPSISSDTIYLGFDSMLRGRMDNSPIYLRDRDMDMDGTAKPCHQHTSSMPLTHCGPRGVDEYLSWCVTGYRHCSKATGR